MSFDCCTDSTFIILLSNHGWLEIPIDKGACFHDRTSIIEKVGRSGRLTTELPRQANYQVHYCDVHVVSDPGIPLLDDMSLVVRKPVFGVSDQVPHKPGCTATEDGWRLEISYLGRRDIVLSV